MNIWAIIPVKPLNRSKSRLSPVLNTAERARFSRTLLERTLTTLKTVPYINGILVVSRDPAALALVRRFDVYTVQESGTPELNHALTRATRVVEAWHAQAVLVLASDIPFLSPADIQGMIELANRPGTIVLAPDRNENGTNALIMRPPGLIPYSYGEGSFKKHCQAAQDTQATLRIFRSPTLALDVDTPDDLQVYNSHLATQPLGGRSGWPGIRMPS